MSDPGKKHSRFSPSGSRRWLDCTASIAECAKVPEHMKRGSSEAADEGTYAHWVAEQVLLGEIAHPKEYRGRKSECGRFTVNQEMIDGVWLYVETVMNESARLNAPYEVEIETRDLWDYPTAGTADARIRKDWEELVIVDFKYGKRGVDAKGNTQELQYALPDWLDGDYGRCTLIIVQPRRTDGADPVSRWTATPADMEAYRKRLKGTLEDVEAGRTKYAPSRDNCHFCDAKPFCEKAYGSVSNFVAAASVAPDPRVDFKALDEGADIGDVTYERAQRALVRARGMVDEAQSYVDAVKSAVKKWLDAGHKLPDFTDDDGVLYEGYKLVEGKGSRNFSQPEAEIVKVVVAAGGAEEDCYEPPAPRKLKSPAQMEKISADVKRALNEKEEIDGKKRPKFIERTPGFPTPALNSDKKAEVAAPNTADPSVSFEPVGLTPTDDFG